MTGGVYMVSGLVYLFFAGGDVEQWARSAPRGEKEVQNNSNENQEINPVFTLSDEKIVKNGFQMVGSETAQTQL